MSGNNGMSMKEFYDNVIEEFGKRLYVKFNNKEQGFDNERIDQIKTHIRKKMDNPKNLFKDALIIKHSSSDIALTNNHKRVSQTGEPVVKEEPKDGRHHEEDDDYVHLLRNNSVEKPDINIEEFTVKKEEVSPPEPIKEEENLEDDEDRDDEEERERKQISEKLKSSLCIHIVGTYEAKAKKHIAKDEATRLELENVFIKHKDKNEEIYCPRLVCEFKKE